MRADVSRSSPKISFPGGRVTTRTALLNPHSQAPFSMVRTIALEVLMDMSRSIGTAPGHAMARLVSGLDLEFGRVAGEAMACPFLYAEGVNSRWDAKVDERWTGVEESAGNEVSESGLIAICERLDGKWFFGTRLVDGDGQARGTTGADGSGHWFGPEMRCSMRTDREPMRGERRGLLGAVSPLLFGRRGQEAGKEGKQDKGSVSRRCISDCLHISFLRDKWRASRDSSSRNGRYPPSLVADCETSGLRHA